MLTLEQFTDLRVLKVIYGLYELTVKDFDLYVTIDQIADAAHLRSEEAEEAMKKVPVTVKEEDGSFLYRLDGAFSHVPPLLSLFYKPNKLSKITISCD